MQIAHYPTSIGVDPDSLDSTGWLHLMFGFFWRGIVFTLAGVVVGAIAGGVVGGVLGAALGIAGVDIQTIQDAAGVIGGILGLAIGFLGIKYYIRWLLRSRFGPYRLALVRNEAA